MKVNALLATILFLGAHNAFATTNEVVISSDCDKKQEIITLIDEITPVRICDKKFSLLKEKETQKKFIQKSPFWGFFFFINNLTFRKIFL